MCLAFAVLLVSLIAMAQQPGVVKTELLLREIVEAMPKGKASAQLRLVAFYVSDPGTPFLDPVH